MAAQLSIWRKWISPSRTRRTALPSCARKPCGGIDTLTTITCQYRWLAHSRSQQNQSLAIVATNPKRLRERLYWVNVSMPPKLSDMSDTQGARYARIAAGDLRPCPRPFPQPLCSAMSSMHRCCTSELKRRIKKSPTRRFVCSNPECGAQVA